MEVEKAKKTYQKPTIVRLQGQLFDKHGSSGNFPLREKIDGVSVTELVQKYGSPLFIFSEATIRKTYKQTKEAFTSRYPDVQFAWSYKTNYLKAICAIYHQEGAIAEVVSHFEYQKARALGIAGEQIIFNGPYKGMEALRQAAAEKAMIHLDNFDEIADLEKVADELGHTVCVALRLNMDTGIQPHWSRFGFNLDNGSALAAVKRINSNNKLKIVGLHSHIGTFMLDPNAYNIQTQKMSRFLVEIEENFGCNIEYIDIGGGFPSKNRLKGIYQPPEVVIPAIDDFAEAIVSGLLQNLGPDRRPKLYIESGRHLIDESGYLITSVVGQKSMPDGCRSYVVDAGVNLLFTHTWYDLVVESGIPTKGLPEPAILNGPLCMNIDIIRDSIMLPRLQKGTPLVISPVGAYNVTQWMQFIQYRPAILLAGENGTVDIIREAEDLTDIERREKLPDRLAL
ncbi:MAG: alanine racemase [Magnetococcales bacterium]|nr:alanine racemase [Magnetococcales bacterium]